ncbi:response regulator transcription factor [Paenibacillus rhizovicinus]|nr:helix-turn-helix domain-containing protein [Paenibacillus rhizovicinus]
MMIVDDEPLVRLALHHMIDWSSLGIRIAVEAGNGVEAMSSLEQMPDIDILVVDIEMPRMNGIELLKTLSASGRARDLAIVVLSAYNNYSYVREAFLLGAMDYVVKTDMDEEHIFPVFTKVVQALSQSRKEAGPNASAESADDMRQRGQERDAFIKQLLSGERQPEGGLAAGTLASDDLLLCGFHQMVLVLRTSGNDDLRDLPVLIQQTMQTILAAMPLAAEIYYKGEGEYVLFCSFANDRSASSVNGKVHSFFATVHTRLKQYANVTAAMGMSELGLGKKYAWHQLYHQASSAAAMRYYRGFGVLLEYEGGGKPSAEQETLVHSLLQQLAAYRTELAEALQNPDEAAWPEMLLKVRKLIPRLTASMDPEQMKAWFVDTVWETGGLLYAKGIRWAQLQGVASDPVDTVRQMETMERSLAWLKELLGCVHGALHQGREQPAYSMLVTKVKKFLEDHYREEISQSAISEVVGVSETYISKQFSKELGCSYMNYLTQLRINEAKKLLKAGFKIAEVSSKVGYSNHEHFSRVFKKITGQNPKAYRESELLTASAISNPREQP